MVALAQYTYIFVITVIFAFLDAWNIGEATSQFPFRGAVTLFPQAN
jgi:hypothetical protein